MNRLWLIASIGMLSFGAAGCGDYDEKNAAYDAGNNAAYEEGNAAYDASDNAAYEAPEGNAGYTPPADANLSANDMLGTTPPADEPPPGNGY